jgi:hypothetical protein
MRSSHALMFQFKPSETIRDSKDVIARLFRINPEDVILLLCGKALINRLIVFRLRLETGVKL